VAAQTDTAHVPTSAEWDDRAAIRNREYRETRKRDVPADTGIASAWQRLGAYLLDILLVPFTLGIGWIIWSLFAWRRGQSPAKQLLGMYVVHDGKRASWWRMLVRELFCKWLAGAVCFGLAPLTYGVTLIPYYLWLCLDPDHKALWDRMAGTRVLEER
jgi:uncharacterized RDD family membrane protein YckC